MPRVHIFEDCGLSSGEGFVKPPSSGMWQCTLPSSIGESFPRSGRKKDDLVSRVQRKDIEVGSMQDDMPFVEGRWGCGGPRFRSLRSDVESTFHNLHPQRFQLISTSSRFLCSFVFNANVHSVGEIDIISFQRIHPWICTPFGTGIAFAAASEATWVDVTSFVRMQRGTEHKYSSVPNVWRLQWNVAVEGECTTCFNTGSTLTWRVAEALPLTSLVEDALLCGEDVVQVAITGVGRQGTAECAATLPWAESKGGKSNTCAANEADDIPRCTPTGNLNSIDVEPPLLQPKPESQRLRKCDPTSPRNLTVEFALAQEMEERGTPNALCEEDKQDATTNAEPTPPKGPGKKQLTYAEILMRSVQPNNTTHKVGSKVPVILEWRQVIDELGEKLEHAGSEVVILSLVTGWLDQPKVRSTGKRGKVVDTLVLTSVRELFCCAQLDAVVRHRPLEVKKRDEIRSLRRCIEFATKSVAEFDKWPHSVLMGLQFAKFILKLRFLRHQCLATVLMSKTVTCALLLEAVTLGGRLLRLLKAGGIASVNFCLFEKDIDTCLSHVSLGVYTAALSLMEFSLFASGGRAVQADIIVIVCELLLWHRCSGCEEVDFPTSVLVYVESMSKLLNGECKEGAERLRSLLRAAEAPIPSTKRRSKPCDSAELCCGVIRGVTNSALFDRQFTRTAALLKRLNTPVSEEGVNRQ